MCFAHYRGVMDVPEVIRARVCAVTGAHAVTGVERIQRLWSGYGVIVRLRLSGAPQASVIVKLVQPPAANLVSSPEQQRSHARKLRSYAVERSFYRRHASRCGQACRVARDTTTT